MCDYDCNVVCLVPRDLFEHEASVFNCRFRIGTMNFTSGFLGGFQHWPLILGQKMKLTKNLASHLSELSVKFYENSC